MRWVCALACEEVLSLNRIHVDFERDFLSYCMDCLNYKK